MAALTIKAKHNISRLLHAYADLRIGATEAEKRCYKTSDSILLTFDDCGSPEEIADLLAVLEAKQTKAMFFIIGEWAEQNRDLINKIRAGGHIVGNHTYSHPNLLELSDGKVLQEITRGIAGKWLRAPQGRANSRVRRLAESVGCKLCYWSIDSRDWAGTDIETMRHTILSELRPGAVILFHINGQHTRELLPELCDDIRSRGFRLASMDEAW